MFRKGEERRMDGHFKDAPPARQCSFPRLPRKKIHDDMKQALPPVMFLHLKVDQRHPAGFGMADAEMPFKDEIGARHRDGFLVLLHREIFFVF